MAARLASESLISRSSHFRVKHVTVVGSRWVPADSILAAARIPAGEQLFSIPVTEAQKRIQKIAWIKQVNVRRKIPDTIEISVVERFPVAAVRGRTLMVVSADSTALTPMTSSWIWDLPMLVPSKTRDFESGKKLTDAPTLDLLAQIIRVHRISESTWRRMNEIRYQDNIMVASFMQPPVDILLRNQANDFVWASAVRFISDPPNHLSLENMRVDIRFPGTIVVTRETSGNEENKIG